MVNYGKYGETAKKAVELLKQKIFISPEKAWSKAAEDYFPESITGQKKGCPKGAFLGLCEEGYVKGVPEGNYTRSKKNKSYAIKAVGLLKAQHDLAKNTAGKKALWIKACESTTKNHNSQMDIVIALWEKYLQVGWNAVKPNYNLSLRGAKGQRPAATKQSRICFNSWKNRWVLLRGFATSLYPTLYIVIHQNNANITLVREIRDRAHP